jgi:hypothetical protein
MRAWGFGALAAATFAVGFVVACSGSSGGDLGAGEGDGGRAEGGGGEGGGSIVPASKGAADLADVLCARLNDCAPAYVTITYGTVSECKARVSANLEQGVSAPGSVETGDVLEACAKVIPATSCSDVLGRNLPTACKAPPGTQQDGAPCAVDPQCASKRCKVGADAVCGVCAPRAAVGAACGVSDDCVDGAGCVSGACVAFGVAGSACSKSSPCNGTLACVGGTCAAPQKAGTACKDSVECDELHGIFCTGKTCEALAFAPPPAACGLVGAGFTVCTGPATCTGLGKGVFTGTCTPAPAEKTACDVDGGAKCEEPARCIGGQCTLPDPASCK